MHSSPAKIYSKIYPFSYCWIFSSWVFFIMRFSKNACSLGLCIYLIVSLWLISTSNLSGLKIETFCDFWYTFPNCLPEGNHAVYSNRWESFWPTLYQSEYLTSRLFKPFSGSLVLKWSMIKGHFKTCLWCNNFLFYFPDTPLYLSIMHSAWY